MNDSLPNILLKRQARRSRIRRRELGLAEREARVAYAIEHPASGLPAWAERPVCAAYHIGEEHKERKRTSPRLAALTRLGMLRRFFREGFRVS